MLNGFYLEKELPERASIITFRFLKEGGLHVEDKTFLLEFSGKSEERTILKTITLTPANLLVSGALLTSKESIILEQIEIIDQ